MFDIKGNYLSSWGGFDNSSEQLNKPEDIAVNNKGRIYVTDMRNSRILDIRRSRLIHKLTKLIVILGWVDMR